MYAVALGCVPSLALYGQSADTTKPYTLPPATVSVTRTDVPLTNVPLSIHTVDRAEISRAKPTWGLDEALANYYRGKGLAIVFTVDATDGLNRAAEAPELVSAGRSITDTMVQRLYREWVFAVANRIRPEYLGLAAETNLIRQLAPDSVYQALVTMANAVVAQMRAASLPSTLYISVQVETVWGRPSGPYQGIAQDLADFPFVEALGLSSYPYLGGFADPESIPLDYYSRIPQGTTLPVLVVEGGWPSVSVGGVVSSPAEEARYITRQERLLDSARAKGVFQLTFYDLDLSGFPPLPPGSILPLFTHLGLADSAMNAKPALAVWDGVFRRSR